MRSGLEHLSRSDCGVAEQFARLRAGHRSLSTRLRQQAIVSDGTTRTVPDDPDRHGLDQPFGDACDAAFPLVATLAEPTSSPSSGSSKAAKGRSGCSGPDAGNTDFRESARVSR